MDCFGLYFYLLNKALTNLKSLTVGGEAVSLCLTGATNGALGHAAVLVKMSPKFSLNCQIGY